MTRLPTRLNPYGSTARRNGPSPLEPVSPCCRKPVDSPTIAQFQIALVAFQKPRRRDKTCRFYPAKPGAEYRSAWSIALGTILYGYARLGLLYAKGNRHITNRGNMRIIWLKKVGVDLGCLSISRPAPVARLMFRNDADAINDQNRRGSHFPSAFPLRLTLPFLDESDPLPG